VLGIISITGVKHLSAFSKKFSKDPNFCTVSVEPLTVPCTIENSHHLRDIALLSITVTLKSGFGSLKVIENYTIQCGTHEFLLTVHIFRTVSEINGDIRRKSPIFPTPPRPMY